MDENGTVAAGEPAPITIPNREPEDLSPQSGPTDLLHWVVQPWRNACATWEQAAKQWRDAYRAEVAETDRLRAQRAAHDVLIDQYSQEIQRLADENYRLRRIAVDAGARNGGGQ